MLKKLALPLTVLAVCATTTFYPGQLVAPTLAAPIAASNGALEDLHQATAHAPMKGALRGKLMKILNSARNKLKAGNTSEAVAQLEAYIALLEDESGGSIATAVANELIADANEQIALLLPYPFAADYDSVPIVALGGTNSASVDWRTKGVVTGVKNQGPVCQSDYAFSVTGAVEGAWGINKGSLVSLSEQQLIDCDDANNGCEGGSPVRALQYLIDEDGSATEVSYPYTAVDGTCKTYTAQVTIDSLARPTPGDEAELKKFVESGGPVSVILRVPGAAWDSYSGGVFDPSSSSGAPRYVAVLIVGFRDEAGTPVWIVKGSYGTSWGDAGYAYIPRGQNAFGIANYVVRPIV